jgi:hypothetical protein
MWVTTSAAVNWDTRLIRMLPPTRIAMFFASVPLVEAADQAADGGVVAEDADQQQARQQHHRQHRPVAVVPPRHAYGPLVLGAHERHVHDVDPGRIRWSPICRDEPLLVRNSLRPIAVIRC